MTTGPADLYRYRATVLRWVDGDTAKIDANLGCRVHWQGSLRCAGYDAPEVRGDTKPAGLAATAYVASLCPVGNTIYIDSIAFEHGDEEDDFGRMLGFVTLADGTDLADEMIAAKQAVPDDGP